jgi:hypothetical protein
MGSSEKVALFGNFVFLRRARNWKTVDFPMRRGNLPSNHAESPESC